MVKGYFIIILSAICFGLIPIFALYAYQSGVTTTSLLFLRFSFSALIFFLYLFLKKENWRITRKQFLSLVLLGGVLYMGQSSFYFTSVKYIPASLAALLLYLYPIFVAVLSYFANKERLSKLTLIAIAISMFGIIFVLGSPRGHINLFGLLLAGGSAIIYSIYIVIGDRVIKNLPPIVTCAYVSLFSGFSFFAFGLLSHSLSFHFGKVGWYMVICIAFFCGVIAMFTFFVGMKIIGPTKASILSMVEPVVTFTFSTLLFHQKLSAVQMIGGIIVLFGAILVVMSREKNKRSENETQPRVSYL
ncbi:MAG: DMT family transporter [Bacillota bacterium]|nr:DMT family transporter [Bacillota bacterium]